jgi:hypothetical protein
MCFKTKASPQALAVGRNFTAFCTIPAMRGGNRQHPSSGCSKAEKSHQRGLGEHDEQPRPQFF